MDPIKDALLFFAVILLTVFLALAVITFLRALTARLITGKWPHQCPRSARIFRNLP